MDRRETDELDEKCPQARETLAILSFLSALLLLGHKHSGTDYWRATNSRGTTSSGPMDPWRLASSTNFTIIVITII